MEYWKSIESVLARQKISLLSTYICSPIELRQIQFLISHTFGALRQHSCRGQGSCQYGESDGHAERTRVVGVSLSVELFVHGPPRVAVLSTLVTFAALSDEIFRNTLSNTICTLPHLNSFRVVSRNSFVLVTRHFTNFPFAS